VPAQTKGDAGHVMGSTPTPRLNVKLGLFFPLSKISPQNPIIHRANPILQLAPIEANFAGQPSRGQNSSGPLQVGHKPPALLDARAFHYIRYQRQADLAQRKIA
jgi:hypothetical protein